MSFLKSFHKVTQQRLVREESCPGLNADESLAKDSRQGFGVKSLFLQWRGLSSRSHRDLAKDL